MKLTVNDKEVKTFTFPDGQFHVNLEDIPDWRHAEEFNIKCSIRSSEELMQVMSVNNVIQGYKRYTRPVNLYIGYLMGARMDRPIDVNQPFTLKVVTDILNAGNFSRIFTFNVHSEISTNLLRSKNILPINEVEKVLEMSPGGTICVAPDKGSVKWISQILNEDKFISCEKIRDSQTGKLSGFKVLEPEKIKGHHALIIDDICDGGGTFVGIGKELINAGAQGVSLYVSHGIFSKGDIISYINKIYTTNSYREEYSKDITMFKIFDKEYIY